MSYNPNPEWGRVNLDSLYRLTCPYCGEEFGNLDEVIEIIKSPSYYKPRCIPNVIKVNCMNTDCEKCDTNFAFSLSAVISAEFVGEE